MLLLIAFSVYFTFCNKEFVPQTRPFHDFLLFIVLLIKGTWFALTNLFSKVYLS